MPVTIADGMTEYMAGSGGACHIEVRSPGNQPLVQRALAAVTVELRALRHPMELDEPLTNYVSPVTLIADGATFWFDAKDELSANPSLIDDVQVLLREQLELHEVIDGEIGFPKPRQEPATPDLSAIDPETVFIARSGARPDGMGLVELAGLIAGDGPTQDPSSVSAVLRPLAWELCRATTDDDDRQNLRPLARLLATSADGDDLRWRNPIVDWFVRDLTPATLLAINETELASAISMLPPFTDAIDWTQSCDVLSGAVVTLRDRLVEVDDHGQARRMHPMRSYRRGEWVEDMPGDITGAIGSSLGGLTPAAGTRLHGALTRLNRTTIEETGVRLADMASTVIWREVTDWVWWRVWRHGYDTASARTRHPAERAFAPFEGWSPSRIDPLVAGVYAAATAAAEAQETHLWAKHVQPALDSDPNWLGFELNCQHAGHAEWLGIFRDGLARRFTQLVADRLYERGMSNGVASIAGRLNSIVAFILLLDTRDSAYASGADDGEADDKAAVVVAQLIEKSYERMANFLGELLGGRSPEVSG